MVATLRPQNFFSISAQRISICLQMMRFVIHRLKFLNFEPWPSKGETKLSDSTVSTLIIGPNDNHKLNSFNISISNIKSKNSNITFNPSQTQIPISNTKQAFKTISKYKLKQFISSYSMNTMISLIN